MFEESKLIHRMTGVGVLMALTIALTLVSNYIQIGSLSINLSLIPVAIAGIMFGPVAGLFVGLVNGAFILLAPSTSAFLSINVWATILICLLKTGLAGLCCGFIFKLFNKYVKTGVVVSSISVPLINTGIFMLGAVIFYGEVLGSLISIFVLVNFSIEIVVTIVTLSAVYLITSYYFKKHNKPLHP